MPAEKIVWDMPKQFARARARIEMTTFLRGFSPFRVLILAAAILLPVVCFLMGRCPEIRAEVLRAVVLAVALGFLLLAWAVGTSLLQMLTNRRVVLNRKGIRTGDRLRLWREIKECRVTDVEAFPGLRALEISFHRRGKETTQLYPFDPSKVEEALLVAFLDEVAARKRWER